ncbi:unnamed protein product [Diplocarpon coronariae]
MKLTPLLYALGLSATVSAGDFCSLDTAGLAKTKKDGKPTCDGYYDQITDFCVSEGFKDWIGPEKILDNSQTKPDQRHYLVDESNLASRGKLGSNGPHRRLGDRDRARACPGTKKKKKPGRLAARHTVRELLVNDTVVHSQGRNSSSTIADDPPDQFPALLLASTPT